VAEMIEAEHGAGNTNIGSNTAAYGGGVLNHLGKVSVSTYDTTNNKALGLRSTDPLGECEGFGVLVPPRRQIAACGITNPMMYTINPSHPRRHDRG